jgi:dTDP-4-amino-4,6-dideoxygalactose transaminase
MAHMSSPIPDKYLVPGTLRDIEEIIKALAHKKLAGTAVAVSQYEAALTTRFCGQPCVAVSSGTAALHSALACSGVGAGDEVIVPAIAPIPTILPILAVGAKPIFVDTEKPGSIFVTFAAMAAAITARTKAVIFLPFWGYPLDYRAAVQQFRLRGIATIEDACQAHFARDNAGLVGTIADFGCFSTHDRKILATGEGGFVVCQTQAQADKIRAFSCLGGMKGLVYGPNYKLSALAAAVGIARLDQVDEQLRIRQRNATRILAGLDGSDWAELEFCPGGVPNYYYLVVVPKFGAHLKMQEHIKTLGITTDFNCYGEGQYRRKLFGAEDLEMPNTIATVQAAITLPVHPGITDEEIEKIIAALHSAARHAQNN